MIPRTLHRTVPEVVPPPFDAYWARWRELHPDWNLLTWQDPIDPSAFPASSPLWSRCRSGAQRAGLIRLEALLTYGGVYVDMDFEPIRPLDPLLGLRGFSAWESAVVAPDALLAAFPGHPAVAAMLTEALRLVAAGADAWTSGPGVSTAILPGRRDWLLLPPAAFYPYHFSEKHRHDEDFAASPWTFAVHHWNASWVRR